MREKLKKRWVHHFEPQDSAEEKWCNLEVKVIEFLSSGIEVMLINSDTGDDLDYEANEEKGLHVIAVEETVYQGGLP